ncbi:MAG: UDPGP type 1 family protein [Lentisphaeria bacterium]|nr:UDPGP type 1 family protein [Lentisphaeria bacterium]
MDETLLAVIREAGQEHVLKFRDELSPGERSRFEDQLAAVNWRELPQLAAEYVLRRPDTAIPDDLAPADFFPLEPRDAAMRELYARAEARGEELLRAGKVCCLTVAGGQGTRLGFDGPKGTYPIGPATGRTLFSYFAGSVARAQEKYGRTLLWFIMTSPINREATEEYFQKEGFFGLDPEQVFFFTQGTMPAFGHDGKLLLSAKDSLSLSPDGHGGTLRALRVSGALDRMAAAGCEYLSYFQVDNPLVPVVYPRFIGLHALEGAEMSAIMLSKTGPKEKLGNFCVSGGRVRIIEYSDLPEALAEKRNPDGTLAFIAGSPAIHVISRAFVEKLTAGGTLKLPWHRADKKIAALDESGNVTAPAEPNGVKLETFIFDAMPLAEKVVILEGDRQELFAPTKNAVGVDSAESCRRMLTARNARRLRAAGVEIPLRPDGTPDAVIEISPRLVLDDADAGELVRKTGLRAVLPGEVVAL